jgi:hypothetical protein
MSDDSAQPMLSSEWIRQPENVELAAAFAQFAAHLFGHQDAQPDPAGPDVAPQ